MTKNKAFTILGAQIAASALFASLGAVSLYSSAVMADSGTYPTRNINMVVPYPPGGGADTMARRIATEMSEKLGVPVVVENRPGANTRIATEYVARQPADGYTLYFAASAFTINPSMYDMDASLEDFTPIIGTSIVPLLLATHQQSGFENAQQVIEQAQGQPNSVTFASYGPASPAHLAGSLWASSNDVELRHIAYQGTAPALTALAGSQVDLAVITIEPSLGLIKDNRITPLAVTSNYRVDTLPDLPSLAEYTNGYEAFGWNGILGPDGIDENIVERLYETVDDILTSEKFEEIYLNAGLTYPSITTDEFLSMLNNEQEKWAEVVNDLGLAEE